VTHNLSIFICSITNHTAQQREKNSGTGRTRLTAALRNGKMKTKVVTTSDASKTNNSFVQKNTWRQKLM